MDGACQYSTRLLGCEGDVCVDGQCTGDICAGIDAYCDDSMKWADYCDGDVAVIFQALGTCGTQGFCAVEETRMTCNQGCELGRCVSDN